MGSTPTAEARIAVDAMSGDLGPVEVVAAVKLARQHQAGIHRHAVHDNGAGTAVADIAAELGTSQIEILAQHFQQRGFRRHRGAARLAVDL